MRNSATAIWILKRDIFKDHVRNYWEPQQQKKHRFASWSLVKPRSPPLNPCTKGPLQWTSVDWLTLLGNLLSLFSQAL